MQKRDSTISCEEDRTIDEEWTIEEFERGRFRKALKMWSANLDGAVESIEGEEEEVGIKQQECRRQSSLGLEQDSEEEGVEKLCDEIEKLFGEIFGQQVANKEAASKGARRGEQGEQRVEQGEQEETQVEISTVLTESRGEEIDWSVRREFMIYQHPNGFVQCWLIENLAIPWGDPDDENVLDNSQGV